MHMPTSTPLTLQSYEVENAFMAACEAHAIRNPETLATLSQAVCHWHTLNDVGRSRVLQHIRNFFPVH